MPDLKLEVFPVHPNDFDIYDSVQGVRVAKVYDNPVRPGQAHHLALAMATAVEVTVPVPERSSLPKRLEYSEETSCVSAADTAGGIRKIAISYAYARDADEVLREAASRYNDYEAQVRRADEAEQKLLEIVKLTNLVPEGSLSRGLANDVVKIAAGLRS